MLRYINASKMKNVALCVYFADLKGRYNETEDYRKRKSDEFNSTIQ